MNHWPHKGTERARLFAAIADRHRAGETLESLCRDYDKPPAAIEMAIQEHDRYEARERSADRCLEGPTSPDREAPPTYRWATSQRGEWWLVQLRDGEPVVGFHPRHGSVPAHRDSFSGWSDAPVPIGGATPAGPDLLEWVANWLDNGVAHHQLAGFDAGDENGEYMLADTIDFDDLGDLLCTLATALRSGNWGPKPPASRGPVGGGGGRVLVDRNIIEWASDLPCEMEADDLPGYDPEVCSPDHSGRCWPCSARVLLASPPPQRATPSTWYEIEAATSPPGEPDAAWFDWAVAHADEMGLSRGPVLDAADAEGWTPDTLRDALGRRLAVQAEPPPLPEGAIHAEIAAERERQNKKWGEQNHPSADPVLVRRDGGVSEHRIAEYYEIPSERRAKWLCQEHARRGDVTWPHIAVEELSEAVSAFGDGTEERGRGELVQLAAVIVQWIACIDRRSLQGGEDT